jgi:hypothetical protein
MPYGSVPDPTYRNYLGTNDPTIRPPTAAEQAAAAAAEAERQRREDAQNAAAAATRAADRAREDALNRDRTANSQFEETRQDQLSKDARARADRERMLGLLGFGEGGTGSPAVSALGSIASGSGGGGGGGVAGVAAPMIASGPSADDLSAEQGARTASKENAGLRLRSGLRGLHGVMAARGIAGSGVEAQGTADLFANSNTEEANTDRAIISARAKRAGEIADRNSAAGVTTGIANAGNQTQLQIAQMNAAAAERSRISNLLLQFGMNY